MLFHHRSSGNPSQRSRRPLTSAGLSAGALAVALGVTLTGCSSGGGANGDADASGGTVKVVAGEQPNIWDIPMRLAEDMGYFKKNGLDVSFVSITASTGSPALKSGSLQFLPTSPTDFASALHQKLPFTSVGSLGLGNPLGLVVSTGFAKKKGLTADSSAEDVAAALADSHPGTSSPNTQAESEIFLKAYGVDPSKLSWVTLPSQAADKAAIASGQIDWFLTSEPLPLQIEASGDGVVVVDQSKFPAWGAEAGYGENIVVQSSWAKKNPKTTTAFVTAVAQATEYIREHPSDPAVVKAAEAVLSGASSDIVDKIIPMVDWSADGTQSTEGWADTTKFLNELGTVEGGAKVSDSDWTNDYAK